MVWVGAGQGEARLDGLFASTPGYKGGGSVHLSSPSCAQLLVGNESLSDIDGVESFARALSARSGKVVLLSYNVPDALVDAQGQSEVRRRILEFILAIPS